VHWADYLLFVPVQVVPATVSMELGAHCTGLLINTLYLYRWYLKFFTLMLGALG
jgi:hypothetical protein